MKAKAPRWILTITSIGIFAAAFAAADSSTEAKAVPAPEQIKRILLDNTGYEELFLQHREKDKSNLAQLLGFTTPPNDAICDNFESVEISRPALQVGHTHAVVIARSGTQCWHDYLTILEKRAAEWIVVDTFRLFSKNRTPCVTFPELVRKGEHEIMVDADTLVSGTGEWQINTTVLRVLDGKPTLVLDETLERNFSVPTTGKHSNTGEIERGEFYLVRDKEGPAQTAILRRATFKKHGASVEFWTIYYWDPIYHRFRGQPIDASSALELAKNAMHPDLHK